MFVESAEPCHTERVQDVDEDNRLVGADGLEPVESPELDGRPSEPLDTVDPAAMHQEAGRCLAADPSDVDRERGAVGTTALQWQAADLRPGRRRDFTETTPRFLVGIREVAVGTRHVHTHLTSEPIPARGMTSWRERSHIYSVLHILLRCKWGGIVANCRVGVPGGRVSLNGGGRAPIGQVRQIHPRPAFWLGHRTLDGDDCSVRAYLPRYRGRSHRGCHLHGWPHCDRFYLEPAVAPRRPGVGAGGSRQAAQRGRRPLASPMDPRPATVVHRRRERRGSGSENPRASVWRGNGRRSASVDGLLVSRAESLRDKFVTAGWEVVAHPHARPLRSARLAATTIRTNPTSPPLIHTRVPSDQHASQHLDARRGVQSIGAPRRSLTISQHRSNSRRSRFRAR